MLHLHQDWFTQGWVDFELKKYTLLAYLQDVKKEFASTRLYPPFADLLGHYRHMEEFKRNKQQLAADFPKTLKGLDLESGRLLYEPAEGADPQLGELDEIVEYSLPVMRSTLEEGKALYDQIEDQIEIGVVGVLPLHRSEGYLLTRQATEREVKAYAWQVTVFEQAHERYRSIRTEWVASFEYGIANTFEQIKLELVRSRKELPNPATYALVSHLPVPEKETFLPIARRKFMQLLAAG
jgi:hypothetical protein